MSQLIVWALSLVLMVPSSWGRSPARVQPFQQYIDYYQFTQLSSTEQKAFILSVMETMAEMEQEVIDADKILTQDHMQKMQLREKKKALNQIKQIFEQFSQNLSMPTAFARAGSNAAAPQYCSQNAINSLRDKHLKTSTNEFVTCMYGTYMSNMVQNGNSKYCVRPACSGNPEFANAHNNAARTAGCSPAQMVCNPSIYGKNTQTQKASCVTLDFAGTIPGTFENIAHNVSLACLMEVTNDPNSDARLSAIAESIINPSSGTKEAAASNFNRMLSIITNVCLCGDVGFDGKSLNSYEQDFDPSYVQYLNGHRSCNALLSQMQLLTNKISQNANYCTQNTFLPPNLANFSSTLREFSAFSNRVNDYMRTRDPSWDPKNLSHRSRAMRLLKERWIVSDGSGLDGTKQIVTASEALDRVFNQQQVNSWKSGLCPMRIDPPTTPILPTPAAPTCTLTVNSKERPQPTSLTVNATALVKDAAGTELGATFAWKLGDRTIESQTSKTFASSVPVEAATNEFSLSATATVAGQASPINCEAETITTEATPDPPTPVEPTCTLSATTGTFTIADGKFAFSAIPTATANPANTPGALAWFQGETEVNPGALSAAADATSVTLVGKFKRQPGTPITCGSVTFTKADTPQTGPKPPKSCTVTISSPKADTPAPAAGAAYQVRGSVSIVDEQGDQIADNSPVRIKWKLNGAEVTGQTSTSFSGSSPSKEVKLSAQVNDISCEQTVVVTTEPPAAPEVEKKACDLSVTQAPTGPGLFSVEASVAPVPDEGQSVTFSGMSELKLVEGMKDVARGNIAGIAQAQKKTIKASYKAGGKDLECQKEIEIPAAQASGPVGPGQQPFVPPAEGSFLLQKRGVN